MAITPLTRGQTVTYSDFGKDLELSPINFDVARKIDEAAIKESIRNILLTDRGERLFNPNLGSDLRALFFDHITPDTEYGIEQTIRNALEAYEPRCNIISIKTLGSPDYNSITVNIIFSIINRSEPISYNVILNRVR